MNARPRVPETGPPRVIVVGAGLAGLVAARHLAAAGATVRCFERRPVVGGRVRTVERDGFRLDRGFQVLFTGYPAVRSELDLAALDLRQFSPGAVLAGPGTRSTVADPRREPTALLATLASDGIGIGDALRLARIWATHARREPNFDRLVGDEPDRSIDDFLREQGLSERFRSTVAAPFYGGITLDRSLSTSKRVFEYTFAALARGDIGVPAAGMGAIPTQLARFARAEGAEIVTDIEVTDVSAPTPPAQGGSTGGTPERGTATVQVETTDDGGSSETQTADAVVIATDPRTASELTGLDSIPTEASACVTQYYRLPDADEIDVGPRLLLNTQPTGPNHLVPHSAVAPESAPDGEQLLSATYLGERAENDDELADRTRETLESWYPARRFDRFEAIHTDRIAFAQFAQPPGIHERLPDVRDAGAGWYLAGEYTRWSSIQGALESGRRAARAVVRDWSAAAE